MKMAKIFLARYARLLLFFFLPFFFLGGYTPQKIFSMTTNYNMGIPKKKIVTNDGAITFGVLRPRHEAK